MNTLDRLVRPNASRIAWDMELVTPDDNPPAGDALGNVGDAVFGLYVGKAGHVHFSTRGGHLRAPAAALPSGVVWQDENGIQHPVTLALGGVYAVIQHVFLSGTTASEIFALRT